eukprot:sb/3474988/
MISRKNKSTRYLKPFFNRTISTFQESQAPSQNFPSGRTVGQNRAPPSAAARRTQANYAEKVYSRVDLSHALLFQRSLLRFHAPRRRKAPRFTRPLHPTKNSEKMPKIPEKSKKPDQRKVLGILWTFNTSED